MRALEIRDKRATVELKEIQLQEYKKRIGNTNVSTRIAALLPPNTPPQEPVTSRAQVG